MVSAMERGESPVVRLVNAILLSSLKKAATELRLSPPNRVEFLMTGTWQLELEPPPALFTQVIRRLAVMASLPVYDKHDAATGLIQIRIGDDREARWHIVVTGHGAALTAHLRVPVDDVPTPYR
jgi:type II secretory ATPase GspE/PulE/Tfp pilus assembly ATPase PilB-like protein